MTANLRFPRLFTGDPGQDETIANEIVNYQKEACSKEDTERIARFVNNEKKRFTVASQPWMEVPAGRDLDEPFLEPTVADDIDLASQNEIAPIVDSESSRLIGSTSEPSVEPDSPTTRAKRGAKFSERVLDDVLYQNGWVDLSHQDARNAIIYGTSYLLTGFELDFAETTKNQVEVMACPMCEGDDRWMVTKDSIAEEGPEGLVFSGDAAKKFVDAGVAVGKPDLLGDMSATIQGCPHCGAELQPRRAMPEDGEVDILGNPLLKDVPLPKAFIRLYTDYDVFPIGNGRVKHGFLPEVTIESIVPIEWLMQRYKAANKVKPVSMATLGKDARWHPSGLNAWGYYGVSLSNDQPRWAVHRITIRQPFIDTRPNPNDPDEILSEPLGRVIESANDTVLRNGPLMVESQTKPGTFFPRMVLHPFQNEVELDTVHGNGSVDRMMDPQRSINAQLTQFEFDMSTMGSPRLIAKADVNLEGQGDGYEADESGYAGQILRNKGDSDVQVVEGKATHQDWDKFMQQRIQAIARATNQSELDRGAAVAGAPSATAQITIGNRLDESRKPKGQRYAERNGRAFSHTLVCVKGTYIDPRQLNSGYRDDKRAPRMWTALDMMDQSTVKVRVKPAHENAAFERQNTIELLPLGLVPIDTPGKRIRVAQKLGLSQDLDPEPSQQLTQAENEWVDFMFHEPAPIAPVVKVRSDAHRLHIEQHWSDLRSPDGEPLIRFLSLHELATDGWVEEFEALEATIEQSKQPAAEPMVVHNQIDGRTDIAASLATVEAWDYNRKAKEMVANLPKNREQRIFKVMVTLILRYPEFLRLGEEDQRDVMMLTRWLAHCEAHEYAEKAQLMRQTVAAEPEDALGNPANPANTPPTPGAAGAPAGRPSPRTAP